MTRGRGRGVEAGQEVGKKKPADKEVRGTLLPDFPILLDLERPAFEEIPDLPNLPLVSRPFRRVPGQEVWEGQDVRKGQEEWQEDCEVG